jgi:hypothetical protein
VFLVATAVATWLVYIQAFSEIYKDCRLSELYLQRVWCILLSFRNEIMSLGGLAAPAYIPRLGGVMKPVQSAFLMTAHSFAERFAIVSQSEMQELRS